MVKFTDDEIGVAVALVAREAEHLLAQELTPEARAVVLKAQAAVQITETESGWEMVANFQVVRT